MRLKRISVVTGIINNKQGQQSFIDFSIRNRKKKIIIERTEVTITTNKQVDVKA